MHKLLSMGVLGALGVLAALAGCDPVKDNRLQDAPVVTEADAAIDAPADAPVDAAPPADYDIAYVNEFTFSNNISSISSFVVVVNRGAAPLALAMTDVPMFTDDNATAVWTFAKAGASTTMLPPGQSTGELSPLATTRIIDSGLVSEPRVSSSGWNFSMQFSNVPPTTTFNLNGQATIAIEGKRITLPFTIHFVPSGTTAFNNASRIRVP
jgi:hypothetical protein